MGDMFVSYWSVVLHFVKASGCLEVCPWFLKSSTQTGFCGKPVEVDVGGEGAALSLFVNTIMSMLA